jgi:hypothetical protein
MTPPVPGRPRFPGVRPGGAPIPEDLFAVPQIEVYDHTYRELYRLAVAWNTTISDIVDRLITAMANGATAGRIHPTPPQIAVHAIYADTRIDAIFDPDSQHVTVCSGPLCGQTYTSPVWAARAVVGALDPGALLVGDG